MKKFLRAILEVALPIILKAFDEDEIKAVLKEILQEKVSEKADKLKTKTYAGFKNLLEDILN
jgi:hypothetical protein